MRFAKRLCLASAVVTGLSGGAHAYIYNIISQMWHSTGNAVGSGLWEVNNTGTQNPYVSFGPYDKSVPAGENLVVFKTHAIPAPGAVLSYYADVSDNNHGGPIGGNYFSSSVDRFRTTGNLVNMSANGNWEFRTRHYGGGRLQQTHVMLLTASQNRDRTIWPTTDQYYFHQEGYQVNSPIPGAYAWQTNPVSVCNCAGRFMTFGPYISLGKGTGGYVADFRLAVDAVTPATDKVATIDVVYSKDDGTTVSVASKDLFRGDFNGNNWMTDFPVEFDNSLSTTHNWQFRVRIGDAGALLQERTLIYKVF